MGNDTLNGKVEMEKPRTPSMLETMAYFGLSALLGATLTYMTVTSSCKKEMGEEISRLKQNALYERVSVHYKERERRFVLEGKQVDYDELARQCGIPLTEDGGVDYRALEHDMFP